MPANKTIAKKTTTNKTTARKVGRGAKKSSRPHVPVKRGVLAPNPVSLSSTGFEREYRVSGRGKFLLVGSPDQNPTAVAPWIPHFANVRQHGREFAMPDLGVEHPDGSGSPPEPQDLPLLRVKGRV